MLKVTATDALRASIVDPQWYICDVKDLSLKPTQQGSIQYLYDIEIVSDLKGDTKFAKVQTRPYAVNAGGISFAIPFLVACGMPKEALEQLKKGEATEFEIDENKCVGKRIKVLINTTEWNNRKQNECVDFMPLA